MISPVHRATTLTLCFSLWFVCEKKSKLGLNILFIISHLYTAKSSLIDSIFVWRCADGSKVIPTRKNAQSSNSTQSAKSRKKDGLVFLIGSYWSVLLKPVYQLKKKTFCAFRWNIYSLVTFATSNIYFAHLSSEGILVSHLRA